jgi:hypothetical protein
VRGGMVFRLGPLALIECGWRRLSLGLAAC